MDKELEVASSQLKLALMALQHRQKRLNSTRSKLSRHYNKKQHTDVLINLLEEVLGVVHQDPDLWDDEVDLLPF